MIKEYALIKGTVKDHVTVQKMSCSDDTAPNALREMQKAMQGWRSNYPQIEDNGTLQIMMTYINERGREEQVIVKHTPAVKTGGIKRRR